MVMSGRPHDLPDSLVEAGIRKCVTIGIATSFGLPIELIHNGEVDDSDDVRNYDLVMKLGEDLQPITFSLPVVLGLAASIIMKLDIDANGTPCRAHTAMKNIMDLLIPLLQHLHPDQAVEDLNPTDNYKKIKEFFNVPHRKR